MILFYYFRYFLSPISELRREDLMTDMDVTNIQRRFGTRKFEKSSEDATSVHLWNEEYGGNDGPIFCYQELKEDGSFSLGKSSDTKIGWWVVQDSPPPNRGR